MESMETDFDLSDTEKHFIHGTDFGIFMGITY